MLVVIKVPWKTQTIFASDRASSRNGARTKPSANPKDFKSMPTPNILPLMQLSVFWRMVACKVVKQASKIPVKNANMRTIQRFMFDRKVMKPVDIRMAAIKYVRYKLFPCMIFIFGRSRVANTEPMPQTPHIRP